MLGSLLRTPLIISYGLQFSIGQGSAIYGFPLVHPSYTQRLSLHAEHCSFKKQVVGHCTATSWSALHRVCLAWTNERLGTEVVLIVARRCTHSP